MNKEIEPQNQETLKLVGFGGFYYGNEDTFTYQNPILEIESEPGFVYGGMGPNWSFSTIDHSVIWRDWDRHLAKTKKSEIEDNDGWELRKLVDDFESKGITIRSGQTLAFYGPNYLRNLTVLGLEKIEPDFETREGFSVSVVDYNDYREILKGYGEASLSILKDEIADNPLGEKTQRMESAERVSIINSVTDEKDRVISGVAYEIQVLDDPDMILRYLIVYSISLGITTDDLLQQGLSYFKELKKTNPLNSIQQDRLNAFMESVQAKIKEFEEEKETK